MFTPAVMDHYRNPRGARKLTRWNGEGRSGEPRSGQVMRIRVLVEGGVIREIGFGTFGCAAAIACGSWTCQWALGRSLDEARRLDERAILTGLGGLPQRKKFCAGLAVQALQAALENSTGVET